MKKEHIYWGLAIISVIGLGYLIYTKYKGKGVQAPEEIGQSPDTLPVLVINEDLVLKKGSKGNEVRQLQQLMQISSDGIFGSQTEAKLFALKGVKEITLKKFKSSIVINQSALPIGTKIMANREPLTSFYNATKKADNTYYSKNEAVEKTILYGQEMGTIKQLSAGKNWYLVEYIEKGFLFDDKPKMYFVKASDVKKV